MNDKKFYMPCIFDEADGFCSALIEKKCEGCKFRKTVKEYTDDQEAAALMLADKGLEPYRTRRNGALIMTTKQRW
ncbi:MAG: hypothetical protein J6J71_01405 [Prevotella sp.]|nr:hypothetical protein [Prevotella sp.]